jgi:hypothetical protein
MEPVICSGRIYVSSSRTCVLSSTMKGHCTNLTLIYWFSCVAARQFYTDRCIHVFLCVLGLEVARPDGRACVALSLSCMEVACRIDEPFVQITYTFFQREARLDAASSPDAQA